MDLNAQAITAYCSGCNNRISTFAVQRPIIPFKSVPAANHWQAVLPRLLYRKL